MAHRRRRTALLEMELRRLPEQPAQLRISLLHISSRFHYFWRKAEDLLYAISN